MKKLLLTGLLMLGAMGITGCTPERNQVDLKVQMQGQGMVEPSEGGKFTQGSVVDVKALPATGWQFSRWEGAVAEAYRSETTVLMDGRKTIRAIFIPDSDPEIMEAPGGIINWRADGSEVLRRIGGEADIEYIMIHAISDAAANPSNPYEISRIRDIFDSYGVESHYVIDREGAIYQFVDDERIAHHAGAGSWNQDPKLTNAMNRYAIGIELLGIGTRAEMKDVIGTLANTQVRSADRGYTENQYSALDHLLHHLMERYGIPRGNIIGHEAYDPGRKWDPGALFDWNRILP